MNKEWFIFKGTHHLGPFSVEEMEEFFSVGEINAHSLVWREGAEKWEALLKSRDLAFLIEKSNSSSPPDLPKEEVKVAKKFHIPREVKVVLEVKEVLKESLKEGDLPPSLPAAKIEASANDFGDEPPPIPLDAILNPQGREFYKPKKSFIGNHPKLVLASLVTVFIMVIAWFFINESTVNLRIKGVMPVYVDKLQEIAAQKTPSLTLAMALSLDGKTIYASTNKDGEILAIIKLQSLPKRILGSGDVEILVRGTIKEHLGVFEKMQLTKGAQFVPGEYNVSFSGRKLHFLNEKFKFLNQYTFFKNFNTDYSYTTTALIYSGTPREFEKKIIEFGELVSGELLKPLNDKLERLQTLKSILNKTTEDYLLALEEIKLPKEISKFEAHYVKEISPLIQSLVLATIDMAKSQEKEESADKKLIATYSSQVQLGKQIGELGADMITDTERMQKVGPVGKGLLKAKFEKRYKEISTQVDNVIIELQAEILKVSH